MIRIFDTERNVKTVLYENWAFNQESEDWRSHLQELVDEVAYIPATNSSDNVFRISAELEIENTAI